jgi:hypothetical protein
MTYTIKGKQYTELDINKRCAEILGLKVELTFSDWMKKEWCGDGQRLKSYCTNWGDAGPIIDKCWDELMAIYHELYYLTKWERIISIHDCTKLTAACICLIELNE